MASTENAGGNGNPAHQKAGGQANVVRDIFELMKSEMGVATLILLGSDLDARNRQGWSVHNQPLTALDGRNFVREAYEEFLDAAVYLRVAMVESAQADNPRELKALYTRTLQLAAILKVRIQA